MPPIEYNLSNSGLFLLMAHDVFKISGFIMADDDAGLVIFFYDLDIGFGLGSNFFLGCIRRRNN